MDTASWELVPDSAQARYAGKIDLCIDHHGSNEHFAKESCVVPECAACGELLYRIIQLLTPMTSEIAALLYLAISTDTGCYVFSNTTAMTHIITAELLAFDFDYRAINKLHFRTKSLRRLYLEGQMIQSMTVLHEGKTVISSIPLSLMAAIGATEDDMDNISAFLEQIEGVEIAVTIREQRENECKVSVRTGGVHNASAICALLGGGGHKGAAGCTVRADIPGTQDAIIGAIAQIQAAQSSE